MIKLVLFRILPAFAAVGIVGAAVSPVKGTLETFGAAADALTGDTNVSAPGITVDTSQLPSAITGIEKPKTTVGAKKKLLDLANKAEKGGNTGGSDDETFGWGAGDRAVKPLGETGN
ncbi:MAG: hypothetical protein ACJ790_03080 [Myxococcaceae bacterium]